MWSYNTSVFPVQVTLTSDAYSQGSGLDIIVLIYNQSYQSLFFIPGTGDDRSRNLQTGAYELELTFNPYCGYQDPYVYGVGGFKRIEFMDNDTIKYEYLPTDIFSDYDTHLVFTGVTRNSKTILKDITANLDKVYPLLGGVDKAYKHLKDGKYEKFLNDVSKGWKQKKKTSSLINENERIKQIDATLSANETVLSHKLWNRERRFLLDIF